MIEVVEGTALPSPTEGRIRWFESLLGVALPGRYRELLTTANGATPIRREFPTAGEERMVERFLCLLDSPKDDSAGWADITVVMSQIDDRLGSAEETGSSLIPIAALFGGDFVCLDFRTSRVHPSVVVWEHERSEEFIPYTVPVAASFEEFERVLH